MDSTHDAPSETPRDAAGPPSPQPRYWLRRLVVGGLCLALVAALAGSLVLWRLTTNVRSAVVDDHVVQPDTTPTGALNVLFIGSDSRDLRGDDHGYGDGDGSRRSDALMLTHFAADNSRIDAVQIPRDTLLDLPSCDDDELGTTTGGFGMINSALQYGQGCTVRAVEALSGVHIDHFVELDFDGFVDMVDAIGGVRVCLPEPLRDEYAHLDLPAGEQEVDGTDALALARTRHAVGDGSDLSRIGHQQMVMSAIIAQATSGEVLSRPDRLLRFLDATTRSVTVDDDLSSTRALTGLAQRARTVGLDQITFIAMPSAAAPTDPNRVVATDETATVFDAIAADRPVLLAGEKDDPTGGAEEAAEQVGVRVFNGAGVDGLAGSAGSELVKAGYRVDGVDTAATLSATTRLLVDETSEARETAERMVEDFGLDADIVEDPTVTGVWLVLGADRAATGLELVDDEPDEPPVETTARTAAEQLCS